MRFMNFCSLVDLDLEVDLEVEICHQDLMSIIDAIQFPSATKRTWKMEIKVRELRKSLL